MSPFKSSAGRNLGKLLDGYKTSTLGLGLAAPGSGGGGGGGSNQYRDYGDVITGFSKASAGAVSAVTNLNADNGTYASWNALSGTATGPEFTRSITWYKGSLFEFGGIALSNGHPNSTDPLPAKDVAIYTSDDTTDGANGTWTIQTPKWIRKSYGTKNSAASGYDANRTSGVSANHWVLGGNYQEDGGDKTGSSSNAGLVYNKFGGAPVHERIYFDPITVKGVRLDIRSRWHNGGYSSEKPHIATGYLFGGNNYAHASTELESDPKTTCYIDPGTTANNVDFLDKSGNGYNFATNNGNNRGTVTYNSGDGGHIQISGGSLRNGANVGRGGSNSFSMGCWIKIHGGGQNTGGGAIWYGSTATDQHVFVRNNISTTGCMAIGADIQGNDEWVNQFTRNERLDAYISSVGVNNWFLFCLRYHSDGLIETSWDARPFDLQFTTDRARASSLTLPFGVGGDFYNDNDSSHYFGPFFFYAGIVPYGRIVREWDRYKDRFGRSSGDPDYTVSFSGNSYNN